MKSFASLDNYGMGLLGGVSRGSIEIVKMMISGTDSRYINSALNNACCEYEDNMDIIRLLVEEGAEITQDIFMLAAKNGKINAIRFFIQRGATYWDSGLSSALYGSYRKNSKIDFMEFYSSRIDIIELLIKKGGIVSKNQFISECKYSSTDIVKVLIPHCINYLGCGLEVATNDKMIEILTNALINPP